MDWVVESGVAFKKSGKWNGASQIASMSLFCLHNCQLLLFLAVKTAVFAYFAPAGSQPAAVARRLEQQTYA
jgi:hypothetical protein